MPKMRAMVVPAAGGQPRLQRSVRSQPARHGARIRVRPAGLSQRFLTVAGHMLGQVSAYPDTR
jgi:hypothetical protein